MFNEQHYITITLHTREDFDQLLYFIGAAGFKICGSNMLNLTMECYVDDLVLSIIEKYLTPHLVFHNKIAVAADSNVIAALWEHKLTG